MSTDLAVMPPPSNTQLLDRKIEQIVLALKNRSLTSLYFLLPLLFQVRRWPMTLKDHYVFEPVFRTQITEYMLWKTARQMGKTLDISASDLIIGAATPGLNTLIVCPRFEQARRVSNQNMRPLLQYSPVRNLLTKEDCIQRENLRELANGSSYHFSFALLDADRVRGLAMDRLWVDEIQDMNWDFLPLLQETLSGSPEWGTIRYSGTPKTLENTMERLWQQSSGAELAVRCMACNHWNIGCLEEDLMRNIGPTTTVCSKCGKIIYPRTAVYVHRHPHRRAMFPGYHVSQPYHPFFFDNPRKWRRLLTNLRNYPFAKFCNECLGESQDMASRLVTSSDIKKACRSYDMSWELACRRVRDYRMVVLSIDWGGGGLESASYTVPVVLGQPPGRDYLDLLYVTRFNKSSTVMQECRFIMELFKKLNPTFVCHDFTGAGHVREALLIQLGMPKGRIMPFTYVGPNTRPPIYWKPASVAGTRECFEIDKARSLIIMCTMLKAGKIRFPRYEQVAPYANDLLALVEDRQEDRPGADRTLINKVAGASDDFAHAVNFGASAIWHSQGIYPSLEHALSLVTDIRNMTAILPDHLQVEEPET